MPIRFGSRNFAPRPFTTLLTLAVLALLLSLGRWQLRRADEKRALFDGFARGTDAARVIDGRTPPVPRYQHIDVEGAYDPSRQVLIDNMIDADGRAGYFVITPLHLTEGGWLLVNRGWVPLGASRAARPDIAVAADLRRVRGRADHLPSPGIKMGTPQPLRPPYPVVANFPQQADFAALLGEKGWIPTTALLLLDADQPDGYGRRWSAPGLPPSRHLAYAVQWFGLSLALAVIYIATNLQSRPGREHAP